MPLPPQRCTLLHKLIRLVLAVDRLHGRCLNSCHAVPQDEAQPHSDEESATSSEAAAVSIEARGSSDLETAPEETQTAPTTTAAPAADAPGSEAAPGPQCCPLSSQVAQQPNIHETAPSSLLRVAAEQAAEDCGTGPTSGDRGDVVRCHVAHASLPQLLAEDSPASSVSALPAASEAQQDAATSGCALQKLWDSIGLAGSLTTLAPPLVRTPPCHICLACKKSRRMHAQLRKGCRVVACRGAAAALQSPCCGDLQAGAPEVRPVQAPLPPLASVLRVRVPAREGDDAIGISLSQAAARAAAAISRATSRAIHPPKLVSAEVRLTPTLTTFPANCSLSPLHALNVVLGMPRGPAAVPVPYTTA